jgi:hypothetical protein
MPMTINIPDNVLDPGTSEPFVQAQVERYLVSLKSCKEGMYAGPVQVFDLFASLPSPEAILALRPTPELQNRVDELLEKNRTSQLDPEEQRELNRYVYLNSIVRTAKANATIRLAQQ